ncbi:MAG: glycosyltransferase [Pseudomonadota bacterium]
MIRADLHVHSKASKRPSEWFLKKVGASESYTDTEMVYASAKASGMDFVTLTDHNTIEGALELVNAHPDDTFVSVETTTYFPEDNCKIHILLYDITVEQFEKIESVRHNIYQLRELIRTQDIAYSVAHGFYSVNCRLTLEVLEKLILLFDVFEGLNGARNRYYNETWQHILKNLTPGQVKDLMVRYNIEPMSYDPWIKGFTGGSDDHAGLFIGQTATQSGCRRSKKEFIQSIKDRKTQSIGRCNDYKSFAFSIYKIFCDYSSHARKNAPGGILAFINTVVFEERQSRLKKWVTLRRVKKGKQIKDKIVLTFFEDVYNWSHSKNMDMDTRLANIYHSMGLLLDEFFKMLLDSFATDFSKGDLGKLFRNLMSCFPALFISIPFFSSLRHLSQDRDVILALKEKYHGKDRISQKKVLWFTDTLNDLNGVSVTLDSFRKEIIQRGLDITFVACVPEADQNRTDSANIMYLPWIDAITPEFYPSYSLNFPSLLSSMEMIYHTRPEKMIISTPGPVGLLGMAMAGMLGIESVCIYHTDFSAQAEFIFKDEAMAGLIQSFINRFYSFATRIKVPTHEYIRILEQQNYNPDKMSLFKRGIAVEPFKPGPLWKKAFKEQHHIKPGTTLMWAGRVSRDKNIEFLMTVYIKALRHNPQLNLVLCGDGPDFNAFKTAYQMYDRILFTGAVPQDELCHYYDIADLFVFPSTTDTFGRVILEAQSRGLPALVTDVGGPMELIKNKETGHVLSLSDIHAWVAQIEAIHRLKTEQPNEFAMLRAACQNHIRETYNWDDALADILGEPCSVQKWHHISALEEDILYCDPIKGVA